MFILTMIITLFSIIGICCSLTNNNDLDLSNIILGLLSTLILLFCFSNIFNESNTSIINTYCAKYYSNNVAQYNECKYNHKDNFSQVIKKGLK